MPIESGRNADGDLVWVANPFTAVVTYLTDIHLKSNGYQEPRAIPAESGVDLRALQAACAFCPGNEALTTQEVLRHPDRGRGPWQIRAFYNLFPRIPIACTGGRNESYVLVETPNHFRGDARHPDHLVHSAMLAPDRFRAIMRAAAQLSKIAFDNPAVAGVVVRKNQGRESGASQPHPHTQVIGADRIFPPVARECEVLASDPGTFHAIVEFVGREGFTIAERDGCQLYFSPFGVFPRCYEVIDLESWGHLHEIDGDRLDHFADMLREGLVHLGDLSLDYEVHADPRIPLHAHIHARHYPYSNIAGTLNLPTGVLRKGFQRRD
jgi:galactose-1-phosphate uridylyltransferase